MVSLHLSLPASRLSCQPLAPSGPKAHKPAWGRERLFSSLFYLFPWLHADWLLRDGLVGSLSWSWLPGELLTDRASLQASRVRAGGPSRLAPCPSGSWPQPHTLLVPWSQAALTSLALWSLPCWSQDFLNSYMSPNPSWSLPTFPGCSDPFLCDWWAPSPSEHPIILATNLLSNHSLLSLNLTWKEQNPYSAKPIKLAQGLSFKCGDTSLYGGHRCVFSHFESNRWRRIFRSMVVLTPGSRLTLAVPPWWEHWGWAISCRTHLWGSLNSGTPLHPAKAFSELPPVCKFATSGYLYSVWQPPSFHL